MAGTFGEPGKNTFAVPGVGGILSPVVNDTTGVTQVYRGGAATTQRSLGTYNPSTNRFTPDANAGLTQTERAALSNQANLRTIRDRSSEAVTRGVQAAGGTPERGQATANRLLSPNTANSPDRTGSTPTAPTSDTGQAATGTRTTNFGNFTYPADLGSTKQDVIKFTILEYQPSGFGQQKTEGGTNLLQLNQRSALKDRKPQGTVTLPIPSGISDTNACNWKTDELDAMKAAAGAAAFSGITQGIGKMFKDITKTVEGEGTVSDVKTAATSVFAAAASGGDNRSILARAEGVIINPNMELLFDGPTLRPFSFTFKMSARNKGEAKTIIDIIRFFKRGMAPIKTEANLFLKTPNTFNIQYLHRQEKDHPFIGRIKECALQSFTTNYTPEGQYATYTDGVMVSYEIQMQFTELEPVFNSDYDDESNYPKVKDGIGF